MSKKTLLIIAAVGIGIYLWKKKASAQMQQPMRPSGPQYFRPVGSPSGPPVRQGPWVSEGTQNLMNNLQTWINQHPG